MLGSLYQKLNKKAILMNQHIEQAKNELGQALVDYFYHASKMKAKLRRDKKKYPHKDAYFYENVLQIQKTRDAIDRFKALVKRKKGRLARLRRVRQRGFNNLTRRGSPTRA